MKLLWYTDYIFKHWTDERGKEIHLDSLPKFLNRYIQLCYKYDYNILVRARNKRKKIKSETTKSLGWLSAVLSSLVPEGPVPEGSRERARAHVPEQQLIIEPTESQTSKINSFYFKTYLVCKSWIVLMLTPWHFLPHIRRHPCPSFAGF